MPCFHPLGIERSNSVRAHKKYFIDKVLSTTLPLSTSLCVGGGGARSVSASEVLSIKARGRLKFAANLLSPLDDR